MRNKINFITGETYTLAELFSGNRKIIIPDLQRDYCWGDEKHGDGKKELVTGFVNSFISQYEKNKSAMLSLGIIYGYEAPENHIQLCDGQQRMTTLFLLIGILNKKSGTNAFRNCLISDFEYFEDDREPYLQYSIRESSLYFIRDIVCNYFITSDDNIDAVNSVNEIEGSRWFFNDYTLDPSILSMLRALRIIEDILNDRDVEWCVKFGDFLIKRISFLYYDMGNREKGEETFVVINTTGEPLTATQNLKPLIYTSPINESVKNTLPDDWEDIEKWFWNHRQAPNDTADAGFGEFLRWVTLLETTDIEKIKEILAKGKYKFPVEEISFNVIQNYWIAVKFLFEKWENKDKLNQSWLSPLNNKNEDNDLKYISQIDCFVLLPLIAYCAKWNVNDISDRGLLRLYNFLINLTRITNITKAVNDLVYDVIMISVNCRDIIELLDDNKEFKVSATILSPEEITKLSVLRDNPVQRIDIENAFWKAQNTNEIACHKIWSGEIHPLIMWSKTDGVFSLSEFTKYSNIFDETFKGKCDSNIDDVRKALITRNLKGYPRIFRGNKNFSFGWDYSDWQILINDNVDKFKSFFDDILSGVTVQDMIDAYPDDNDYSEFVKCDYLLGYCEQKKMQWFDEYGWMLILKSDSRCCLSVLNKHLFEYLNKEMSYDDWKVWDWKGNTVVVENEKRDIVIDIRNYYDKWNITFFKRKEEVENNLKPFIDSSWTFNGERYEKNIDIIKDKPMYTYPEVVDEISNIIGKIVE